MYRHTVKRRSRLFVVLGVGGALLLGAVVLRGPLKRAARETLRLVRASQEPRKAKPLAPLAPAQLRRPRTAPHPLPRTRSARGTEPRPSQFEVEHTAQDVPMFDADDLTFVEDGQ